MAITPSGDIVTPTPQWHPFGLGFRPFFLLAGISGLGTMFIWLIMWSGGMALSPALSMAAWHKHEMLFGYTVAVIAGFLLTATRNWTGRMTLTGMPLALLAILWFAGRLLPWLPSVPYTAYMLVDMLFLPLLALAITPHLLAGKSRNNLFFIPLLLTMAGCNGLIHASQLGWIADQSTMATNVMVVLVAWLIIVMAGRVLPFFIEKALPDNRPLRHPWIETAVPLLNGLWLLATILSLHGAMTGSLLIVAAVVNWLRLLGWSATGIWRRPMLWILYTGYGWLVFGLALLGLAEFDWISRSAALHALTAGGIGAFTLGMMARVSRGHTGREITPDTLTVLVFWIINLAVLLRVLGPLLMPDWQAGWILASGLLWAVCFAAFLAVHTPILLRSRVDGRPD